MLFRQLKGNFEVVHVPREWNQLADWLSKIGQCKVHGDVTVLTTWMQPGSLPLVPIEVAVALLHGKLTDWVSSLVPIDWW